MLDLRRGAGSLPDRLRLKAIAALNAGPASPLAGALAAVALLVGAAGLLLLATGSAPGAQPPLNLAARWCLVALVVVAAAALIAYAVRRRGVDAQRVATETSARRELVTAAMLAASVLLPVLLLPIHYLAARTHPSPLHWNAYGFLDKRWLTTTFLILTLGSALLLVAANRVVATARRHPASWRDWLRAIVPAERAQADDAAPDAPEHGASRPRLAIALKLACAVAVAAYFFGPP
ncbi:MAG: hypothetical protein QOG63_1148, partial [Thermoleophilaceae bacterium]|nr:hypothetical protein [Thermoleophilaceae bacterium]